MINKGYPTISNKELLPSTHLLWLEAPELAKSARPGQFAMLRCDRGLKRVLRRPLTVHQVEGTRVAFLYRIVGEGTAWLAAQKAGDTIDVLGPLGNGFTVKESSKRLLLVAGGMGFAPLRFLADRAIEQGRQVTVLLGARDASGLYPARLLSKSIRLITCTEDGSAGEKGLVTGLLGRYASEADQVFACGPEPMYRAMLKDRQALGKLSIQVSLEVRMGCGIGACLSCSVKTTGGQKHVCKDGPVFDLDEVVWGASPVCAL